MPDQVLQITDHDIVVFGLTWRVLDSMEPRGQQVNKLRDNGAKFSVSFKNENTEENLGVSNDIDLGSNPKNTRLISGAAQIARHKECVSRDAVLVTIEVPGTDGHAAVVAVVGVLRGNIVLDEIVTPGEVQAKREWFLGEASNRQIRLSEVGGVAYSIPDVDFPLAWEDILATRAPGLPLLPKSQYLITALAPQINPKVLKVGAALCSLIVVGVAGWQGYEFWKASVAKKKAAMARKAPDPQVIYQQSVQALLDTPIFPAKTSFALILQEIGRQVPVFRRSGWVLEAVKCEAESTVCVYSWRRVKGTMATFRDSAVTENWDSVEYGVSSITTTKKMLLNKTSLPERQSWLGMDRYSINERSVWTRWQDLGVKFSYGEPAVAGIPMGIAEAQIASSPVLVRSLAWKLEGPAWSFKVLHELPGAATLQSLSLSFKTESDTQPSMDMTAAGQIFLK